MDEGVFSGNQRVDTWVCNIPVGLQFYLIEWLNGWLRESRGRGMRLRDENERGWKIKQVLYVDDAVLLAKSERLFLTYYGWVWESA